MRPAHVFTSLHVCVVVGDTSYYTVLLLERLSLVLATLVLKGKPPTPIELTIAFPWRLFGFQLEPTIAPWCVSYHKLAASTPPRGPRQENALCLHVISDEWLLQVMGVFVLLLRTLFLTK